MLSPQAHMHLATARNHSRFRQVAIAGDVSGLGAGIGRGDQLVLNAVDAPGDLGRIERFGVRVQRRRGELIEDGGAIQPQMGAGFIVNAGFKLSLIFPPADGQGA